MTAGGAGPPAAPDAEDTGRPASVPGRRLAQLDGLDVTVLRGVGEGARRDLEALGIRSVLDLLTHYPRRYIDGTRMVALGDVVPGESVSVLAEVRRVRRNPGRPGGGRGRGRGPARVDVEVVDPTGRLQLVFFNQVWRAGQLPVGTLALFYGKVGAYRGEVQMVNPTAEVLRPGLPGEEASGGAGTGASEDVGTGRVFPVYPLSEKAELTSARLARFVGEALDRAGELADPVPEVWRRRFGLVGRTAAWNGIHRPTRMEQREPSRRRLAFDELFRLQLALVLRRRRLEEDARGIRHAVVRPDGSSLPHRFLAALPFEATGAQRRAIDVILADLAGPLPMHRLLQGDVGSGKTVVAVATLLAGVGGGHQGALMAPTEVLAEQHAAGVGRLIEGLSVPDPATLTGTRPVTVRLLTSRTGARERAELHRGLAEGTVDLVIGTHALLGEDVAFASLGVVVIDEQHRFGVEQRAALREKGRGPDGTGHDPDLLVMTATPIPRTAAMVVFGDLDMTVVDELPPGRTPVQTTWARTDLEAAAAWARVREEVSAGRRAYVVCPLVDGSERVEAASAVRESERLAAEELSGLRLGLLHGQMSSVEKESVMASFREGTVDVLVATTVVEVGVDVAEATVMVVEDADRFGIAQLHQLRGRVGRGGDPSWCFLLSRSDSPEATARLEALERTGDGFELADVDLALRGEGTILGAQQKGRSDLLLARLLSDRDLVDDARVLAEELVGEDPSLARHPLLVDELRLFVDDDEAAFLFKS